MKKIAFKMQLKPGFAEEYKRRHDAIWPELSAALKEAGIADYSIFLDEETNILFAVQRLTDEHTAGELPKLAVMQRWWAYMADLMETHPDHSPVVRPLPMVFHLD